MIVHCGKDICVSLCFHLFNYNSKMAQYLKFTSNSFYSGSVAVHNDDKYYLLFVIVESCLAGWNGWQPAVTGSERQKILA